MHLPEMTRPDKPVYAVLSAMAADGSVLQVATGLYSNSSSWRCFADLVTSVGSTSQAYQQLLNESEPSILPNATVSISIFSSPSGQWNLAVTAPATDSRVVEAFPSAVGESLKAGDQEPDLVKGRLVRLFPDHGCGIEGLAPLKMLPCNLNLSLDLLEGGALGRGCLEGVRSRSCR